MINAQKVEDTMKKFTYYKMEKASGHGALARYFSASCRAVLYMKDIIAWALATGSDVKDTLELCMLHEFAHYLQFNNGITVETKMIWLPGEKPLSEVWADEYAWRTFFKLHHRWANVKGWM
jgi:hypothetical protein